MSWPIAITICVVSLCVTAVVLARMLSRWWRSVEQLAREHRERNLYVANDED